MEIIRLVFQAKMVKKKAHNMKMHIYISLGILLLLYYFNLTYKWIEVPTDTISLIKMLVVGLIYANMPDIDQPGSITNKYATILLVGVVVWAFYTNQMMYGIIAAVILGAIRLIEHRTILHSVVGIIALSLPLLFLGIPYFIIGVISALVHLVSDGEFSLFAERDWW